jgi:transposase-like protein
LTGPDGLLKQLTKAILETALNEELTEHLGFEKNDPAGAGSGNIRNGTRAKTVLTEKHRPGHHQRARDAVNLRWWPQVRSPARVR